MPLFRFTIRELLMLTAIVGLALGWGLRDRQLTRERDRALGAARWWSDVAEILETTGLRDGWEVTIDPGARTISVKSSHRTCSMLGKFVSAKRQTASQITSGP